MIPSALLGGIRPTHSSWVSRATLQVRFESIHADRLHQVYAGRQKVGQTLAVGERLVVARIKPTRWPPRLTIVAVLPSASDQDFGELLPVRAFNTPRLTFTASGGSWANAKVIRVRTGEAPGDPVGDVEVARRVFEWEGQYQLRTKPLASGYHRLRIEGVDGSPGGGNVGTAAEVTVRVAAHPPDLVAGGGGGFGVNSRRFSIEVEAGVATIGCEVPA